mmetsp:Transcript_20111/g.34621  ORF Transcript_20111/g.34621 Transcript_20111/m.34621 type:complete len:627 (-) Transcript_20111:353-2233(-)
MADVEVAPNGTVDAKKSKTEKRKDKKQKNKNNKQQRRHEEEARLVAKADSSSTKPKQEDEEDIVIEYVSAPLELETATEGASTQEEEDAAAYGLGAGLGAPKPKDDPFADFKRVFEKFASAEAVTGTATEGDIIAGEQGAAFEAAVAAAKAAAKTAPGSDSDEEEDEDEKGKKMSRKQKKALYQLKIAQLKQICERPDVVEVWDVTSLDPQLLVHLKSYRNTVPVPRHWSQKRKYLQGKRGIEKPAFKLPDFIEATGIGEMRQTYQEKEDAKKQKQKQRERMQPKMGRMDIDYQVLHDAFFKHQTRPKLTSLGELYYEGKEYEARVENCKPGILSEELRTALGMTDDTSPPPWLINMQRYGPPPSYPNLRVQGLNAPIPQGAQFGYHAGGWGKPPVDEFGNAVYGDVFGQKAGEPESDDEVDKGLKWGELEPELEESEESEEEEEGPDEDQLADGIASGIASGLTSGIVSGLASGIASSLPSGMETPDVSVQLRKGNESNEPRQLYQVLEQKAVPIGQNTLLGTDHIYVMPGAEAKGKKSGPGIPGLPGRPGAIDIEVTLTPEEMEGLDEAGIKALYDEKVAEARSANKREDFSDMVAERAHKEKRKLQQKQDAGKKQKTGKDFKF